MAGPREGRGPSLAEGRHIAARSDRPGPDSTPNYLAAIVIGYFAAVVTSVAIMLTLIKYGW